MSLEAIGFFSLALLLKAPWEVHTNFLLLNAHSLYLLFNDFQALLEGSLPFMRIKRMSLTIITGLWNHPDLLVC
jgi:hypothetical protein